MNILIIFTTIQSMVSIRSYGIQRVIQLAVEGTPSIFLLTNVSCNFAFWNNVTKIFGTAVDELLIGNVELDEL